MTFDEYAALPKAERLARAKAGVISARLDTLTEAELATYERFMRNPPKENE